MARKWMTMAALGCLLAAATTEALELNPAQPGRLEARIIRKPVRKR